MRLQVGNENGVEAVAIVPPLHSVFDDTTNDSNKSFVVPEGELWKLNWAHIELVSTADVGNRQMQMVILDADGNTAFTVSAGVVQAASLTRDYHFMPGTYREAAFVAGEIQVPFSMDTYLPAGWTLRFLDSAAIAAAADDMTVSFQVQRFKGG